MTSTALNWFLTHPGVPLTNNVNAPKDRVSTQAWSPLAERRQHSCRGTTAAAGLSLASAEQCAATATQTPYRLIQQLQHYTQEDLYSDQAN